MIRNLLVAAGALLVCVTLVPTRADAEVRFGPSADVAAVAALATKGMSGSYTVGPVVVVGSAAFAEVYSEASAEFFAKKINGKWKIVETNGGAGTAAGIVVRVGGRAERVGPATSWRATATTSA